MTEAGRGLGTVWSCRLSLSGHMLAGVLQTTSEILPNTPDVSPDFNINTHATVDVTEILLQTTRAFETTSTSVLVRNESHSNLKIYSL